MTFGRARFGVLAIACALAFGACGGDDEADAPADDPAASTETAALTEAAVQTTIEDYVAAMRTGDTEAICALEDEPFQEFKYGSAGKACLDDLANQQAQPVYVEQIKVGNVTITGDVASADVQPYGSPDKVLTRVRSVDGELLVAEFS